MYLASSSRFHWVHQTQMKPVLVIKACRLLYHSTPGLKVIKKKSSPCAPGGWRWGVAVGFLTEKETKRAGGFKAKAGI